MKRLTAPWTTALATAALLALPIASSAQTPQAQPEPQPEQSTTLSTPSAQNQDENVAPAEHLRQAKAALANVEANNVPASAKSQLAELRRHINSLERSVAANDNASPTGSTERSSKATSTARGKANWANDVAAIDRIITQLAGSGTSAMSGSGQTGTAGTSGSATGTTGNTGSSAMTLDETTRAKLLEVRSHITAFAAAMSGTSAPKSPSSTNSNANMGAGAAHSSSAHGSAATGHAGAATTGTSGQTGSAAGETAQTSEAGQTGSATTGTTGQTATGEPGQPPAEQTGATQENVDPEAAKQHLTAARDSLTQLTQLPQAAQLQGEARTQVSQLIQNFNELITTKEDWRAPYEKLAANLTALLGPETADASNPSSTPQTGTPEATPANPPSDPQASSQGTQGTQSTQGSQQTAQGTQGTEGAVGTSGTTTATLDPAVRQKLVDFRNHLKAFHQAAGGDEK